MTVKHYVNIDLSKRGERRIVPISKGDDNSHEIIFSLSNGAEPVDISTRFSTAGIAVRNGIDDKGVVDQAFVIENTVVWRPSVKALSVTGNILSTLAVTDSAGSTLYAPSFYLWVEEDFSENIENELYDALKGSDSWGIIQQTAQNAQKAYSSAESAAGSETNAKEAARKAMISIDGTIADGVIKFVVRDGTDKEIDNVDVDLRDFLDNFLSDIYEKISAINEQLTSGFVLEKNQSATAVGVDGVMVCSKDEVTAYYADRIEAVKNNDFAVYNLPVFADGDNTLVVKKQLDEVDKRIDKLEGILIKKTVDDSIAYEKSVPEDSAQKAILSSVGGASRVVKSNNLCTNAKEGGIALSSDGDYIDTGFSYTLPAGTYTASCSVDGDLDRFEIVVGGEVYYDKATFPLTEEGQVDFYIMVNGSSAIAFPMINEGATALPYEPYFEPYVESAPVTKIVSQGENLVDDVALFESCGFTKRDNGYWYGSSKTITVFENTENKTGNIAISYKGKSINNGGDCALWFVLYYTDGTSNKAAGLYKYYENLVTSLIRHNKVIDRIEMSYKTAGAFVIKDLMLKWSEIEEFEYKPYFKETYTIPPETIPKLPGYGEGNPDNPDECNMLDFDSGVYRHRGNIKENGWVALEKEVEINVSDDLKKLKGDKDYFFIEVQNGGPVRFENDKKMAVPSTITFAEV